MRVFLAILLVISMVSLVSFISAAEEVHIYITEYGIYEAVIEKNKATLETASGVSNLKEPKLIEQTVKIPAALGKRFGYRFIVSGDIQEKSVDIVLRVRSPRITRPSDNKEFSVQEVLLKKILLGQKQYVDYGLSNSWELVPGLWSMQLFYKDKLLAEKTFTVYAPY